MCSAGVGNLHFRNGKMNKFVYLNLGITNNFGFYRDNDIKHTFGAGKLWLIHNCPTVIETSAQSSNLNVMSVLGKNKAVKYMKKNSTR